MKLRRIFAAVMALVLMLNASSFGAIHATTEKNVQEPILLTDGENTVISAPDTNYILRSAAVKYIEGSGFLERGDTTGLYEDDPRIDTLLELAPGQFNEPGKEWVWIAYKVSVPADGSYTLGVTTNSCKWADFKIPMVVNREVYTLTFTAKAQTVTAEANLPAGDHVVTVFWPMPANEEEAYPDADWNNYLWCNIASVTVDETLTVSKPTYAEVEASFEPAAEENAVISAVDTDRILHSATIKQNPASLGRTDQATIGADQPTIETLFEDARNQFNKAGEEWNWFAYQVTVPADGTYTLGVKTSGSKYASYKLPLCVDSQVYALQYTEKAQLVTTEVTLNAGVYTVVMFMPLPATKADITNNVWNDYHWCDIESVTVDSRLTVGKPTTEEVEEAMLAEKSFAATDNSVVLWSAAMGDNGNGYLEFNSRDAVKEDMPYIQSLLEDAPGEFNKAGEEWGWLAYQVTAPADGTYSLALQVQNCRNAPYDMPLFVNGEVYILSYSATGRQTAAVDVTLPAGLYTVVVFMPMPQNEAGITGETWVDYPWCNPEQLTVDGHLTISKPTVEDVENCFPVLVKEDTVISAVNTEKLLLSATIKQNANTLGRTDQAIIGADQPTISTIYQDAFGQFNEPGEEWNWFAYKVTVYEEGTYNLGVKTAGSKYASYQIPLCVNGQVYALQFTENAQQVKVEVILPAGEHTVVMFMPMPATKAAITSNVWNDYHWCDIESVTVDGLLGVSKPTVEEVEACFPDLVADSPLKEQSVLFVGDSITYSQNSWASVIGTAYRMDWTNGGVNGATISDVKDQIIRHQLMAAADKNCDYVILHGGINDAMSSVAIGTVSDSFNVADFDTETYIGGLETLFYYAYENFPGAKIGYIINYATPNSKFGGYTAGDDTKVYYEEAKKACDKWGIPYIDLYSGTAADGRSYSFDILQVDTAAENFINSDAQEIHLSAAGYALISPYIAQWMENLTENPNPISDINSGKYINANDADKVLYGNFTPKSEYVDGSAVVGLQDRVYTGMAEDQATIEMLPYAKDMLGDWAFASIAVDAAQDGEYTFRVEMSAKTAYQMGMLVDGEVYTLTYTKENGYYQFMEQTVTLTKGIHYITFTAAMPNNDNELEGDAWNVYPWTNIAAIVVDEGLQVLSKPAMEDVTEKLQSYTPAYTRVEAENAEYVLYNNYNTPEESNAKASGGMVVGGAWNSTHQQTFGEVEKWLSFKGNAYVEYAVTAPADGEYDIRVAFLAGSNDKTIAKPYIAVVVNNQTYQAQFSKDWNQIDKVKLTVSLKKGLNIIRCTSMTTEQDIYKVKGWINHDFLDLDTRLTPVKRIDPVKIEAENSKYYNKLKVQAGEDTEAASGKVLGSSNRKYVSALKLALDQIKEGNLRQVPYVSFTVAAPQNGYYPIRVAMSGDGRLKKSTVGMIVDGRMHAVEYVRTDKTSKGAMVETLVYLTAGTHIITFTTPMPATSDPNANYSYYWSNYDYVMLYDGLVLANSQKSPTSEPEYVLVEVEENAMFNLNRNNGTAVGNANYKCSQSVAEMLENGIDGSRTPFVELTVQAEKAGTYVLYLAANAGMTEGNTQDEVDTQMVIDINGTLSTQMVHATKSTNYTILPMQVELQQGMNIIRLTHLSSDAHRGGTTWIDFDYIEMPAWEAEQITFVKPGETLEAESARYDGFGESLSSSYSGGRYLGRANYDTVAEVNITYDTLDPANLNGLPHVTYRVFSEKAGTYAVAVGFGAGLTNYTPEEIQKGVPASFVVITNGETKQRVEFMLGSTSANMTRLIQLELREGENEVTVTGTTTEYVIDRIPRNEETYRLVWIDQDYLMLSGELSNLGQDVDPFNVEDSGYDFAQLIPREPSKAPDGDQPDGNGSVQPKIPVLVWIITGIGVVAILAIIVLIAKKKNKN